MFLILLHLHPLILIALPSMPFSTDDSWPPALLRIFEIRRNENEPFESRYHGPYTRLLSCAVLEALSISSLRRRVLSVTV